MTVLTHHRPGLAPDAPRRRGLLGSGLALAVLAGALAVAGGSAPAQAAPACAILQSGAATQANAAVTEICGLIGTPYAWGGGHGPTPGITYGVCDPANGAPNDCYVRGLDCSGLVRYAYYLAVGSDIIAGTAAAQYASSRAVARFSAAQGTAPLLPGDLVFYGTAASTIHHVAMYIGQGYMVEAPYSGGYVQVNSVLNYADYYGAIRLYTPGGSTQPPTGTKYWVDTFATASVYATPTSTTATGTLYQGTNYVFCKAWGREIRDGSGNYNHWWLLTDPDVGPAGQYVSAYYLARWGNDEARDNNGVEIPTC